MDPSPDLLVRMEPLRMLLGTWRGEGAGRYPTIAPFSYVEEVTFWHAGKPFLGYEQRTRDAASGLPLHAESGFWRVVDDVTAAAPAVTIEAVIAHPTGISEVLTGSCRDGRVDVTTTQVTTTPTAKDVTRVARHLVVDGDTLTYEVEMAAVGLPLQHHLAATLHRVA